MLYTADRAERLDRFLAREIPGESRSRLAEWISTGHVVVEGKDAKPGLMLRPGMVVRVEPLQPRPAHDLTPAELPLEVPYEDAELLVVNKPRGLATHPAPSLREPTLVNALLARSGDLSAGTASYRPGIVHRLDKATTGLLLVAKTDRAHHAMARQIAEKTAERRYLAAASGNVESPTMNLEGPLARDPRNRLRMAVQPGGKPAQTLIKRLERLDRGTLLAVRLMTGRTHQIRAHLRWIGHPVLGDALYGGGEGPLGLHAAYIEFSHPASGERMAFYCAPPADFPAHQMDPEPFLRDWETRPASQAACP